MVPKGYCPTHAKADWRGNGQPPARIRGRKLQRLRSQLFNRDPLCVMCKAQGKVTIATIRDHVVNLQTGGRDDESNVQALCQACSDTKTQAESLRGRMRTHEA